MGLKKTSASQKSYHILSNAFNWMQEKRMIPAAQYLEAMSMIWYARAFFLALLATRY